MSHPTLIEPVLLVDIRDGIAVLTFNRPQSRNALNSALRQSLISAFRDCELDKNVRGVILTGSGTAFCAGIDLKEAGESPESFQLQIEKENVVDAIDKCTKPVIGAINGPAVTGGFELALACDCLIAARSAHFVDNHVLVGVYPGWGLSQRLSRSIGLSRAKELSLSGRSISAAQALEWGLVNHVVPDDQLSSATLALAGEITIHDPSQVSRIKQIIDIGFGMELKQALFLEAENAKLFNAAVHIRSAPNTRAASDSTA